MPASAPRPISASETKRRFPFLRPPILFTAFHLSTARNALITLSIIAETPLKLEDTQTFSAPITRLS
jgi:hypothetical protein